MDDATSTTITGTGPSRDMRRTGGVILSGLSGGHGLFHWLSQSVVVLLPEIQSAFQLSAVGVGGILTTRELASGIAALPGGVISDVLRRHWGLLLAVCIGGLSLGCLVIGLSPVYPLMLVGMALMAIAHSTWHLPASASLSHYFPQRRGMALSFHGVGGSVGDVVAPVATGALLTLMSWRGLLSVYAVAPLLLAFVAFWAFKDVGRTADAEARAGNSSDRVQITKRLLRRPAIWWITLVMFPLTHVSPALSIRYN